MVNSKAFRDNYDQVFRRKENGMIEGWYWFQDSFSWLPPLEQGGHVIKSCIVCRSAIFTGEMHLKSPHTGACWCSKCGEAVNGPPPKGPIFNARLVQNVRDEMNAS